MQSLPKWRDHPQVRGRAQIDLGSLDQATAYKVLQRFGKNPASLFANPSERLFKLCAEL